MADNSETIARVNYFERQFLRTQDFTDEQAYHIAARRRHNIAGHRWGIVTGLALVAEEGSLYLQPGMAVDGYGRELVVPERRSVSTATFAERGGTVRDVWLAYSRTGAERPPRGYAGCDPGDPNAGTLFYRWLEQPTIRLTMPPDAENPDRRKPDGVPSGNFDFPPSRTAPDDPARSWPVFLGQVTYDANDPRRFQIDLSNRPYVGLVGEAVVAPSGLAWMQLGLEPDAEQRFAVYVSATDPLSQPLSPEQRRLAISASGLVEVRGDATVNGNLTIAGGAIELLAGKARSTRLSPWRLYHIEREQDTGQGGIDGKAEVPAPPPSLIRELRIEMERTEPPTAMPRNRVVIGSWHKAVDATGHEVEGFKPCLEIDEHCNVTVHGNLHILGTQTRDEGAKVSEGRPSITGGPTAATQLLLSNARLGGLGGSSTVLSQLFRLPYERATESVIAAAAATAAHTALMAARAEPLDDRATLERIVKDVEGRRILADVLEELVVPIIATTTGTRPRDPSRVRVQRLLDTLKGQQAQGDDS